jgi:hypothetical protein
MRHHLLILCLLDQLLLNAQVQWAPNQYQRVPEVVDCTIGDIAVARSQPTPHIRYCPQAANQLNQLFPGAGHFYYVHEYGHILLSANEADADNFAATQLALLPGSYYFINAMVSHLYFRSRNGEPAVPGYGTPLERANRILQAALNANSKLSINSSGLLYDQ